MGQSFSHHRLASMSPACSSPLLRRLPSLAVHRPAFRYARLTVCIILVLLVPRLPLGPLLFRSSASADVKRRLDGSPLGVENGLCTASLPQRTSSWPQTMVSTTGIRTFLSLGRGVGGEGALRQDAWKPDISEQKPGSQTKPGCDKKPGVSRRGNGFPSPGLPACAKHADRRPPSPQGEGEGFETTSTGFAPLSRPRMMLVAATSPDIPNTSHATTDAVNNAADDAGDTANKKRDPPAERRRKRRLVRNALYVVWGIAVVGAVLIVFVLLWGIRIRRQTRSRTSKQPPYDPLWYLKTSDQTPNALSPADNQPEKTTETGDANNGTPERKPPDKNDPPENASG